MKLEAGKYYKTRSGRKAFVAGANPFPGIGAYRLAGFVDGYSCITWTEHGSCGKNEQLEIVAEWTEPEQKTVTFAMWRDRDGNIRVGEDRGAPYVFPVIARKTVTITEGEGLPHDP